MKTIPKYSPKTAKIDTFVIFYTIISVITILTTPCIVAISIYLAFEIIRTALRKNRVTHATIPIY